MLATILSVLFSMFTGHYRVVSSNTFQEPHCHDSHQCRDGWRHGAGLSGQCSAFHIEVIQLSLQGDAFYKAIVSHWYASLPTVAD